MKILYITTIGGTMTFFKSLIKELIDEGHVVDVATNETDSKVPDCFREWGCKVYPISTSRSPFSTGNIRAVKEIRSIAKDYDIVHCHTPLAAMATRLACRPLRKDELKVIYTAHGFHFYSGAPLKNWLLYFPMEWLCAHWTDVLITINKEDYQLAKRKMKAKTVEYVPGVGIDLKEITDLVVDKEEKRKEIGIPKHAKMILSVGELNTNKNYRVVIEALGIIKNENIHYVIAGAGNQKESLEKLAKELKICVHLLGYRKDVLELYKCADLNVFPSIREGLGMAALEGMACGLPLVCSDNRGSKSYATKDNSIMCKTNSPKAFADAISSLLNSPEVCKQMGENGRITSMQYSNSIINRKMMEIYRQHAISLMGEE